MVKLCTKRTVLQESLDADSPGKGGGGGWQALRSLTMTGICKAEKEMGESAGEEVYKMKRGSRELR